MTTPNDAHLVPPSSRSSWASMICIAVLAIGILFFHARSFLPFISDDALISLQYSQRLLEGHGLTWGDGPRVEGYTNLLWVLACAALGRFGVDLIDASRFWGFVGTGAAVAAVVYAARPRRLGESAGALAAAVGLALTAPLAVWTVGGLEQPFVAAFLAWATVLSLPLVEATEVDWRKGLMPGFFLGLLCLTRADGGVLCIALALGFVAARGINAAVIRLIAGLAIWPVVMGGGQLFFRLAYYGEWLPNPARVKVAFTTARLMEGLKYVGEAAPYLAGLLLAAGVVIVVGFTTARLRRRTAFVTTLLFAWTAYVVFIGGDIFPAHRHLIVTLVLAAILIAQIGEHLASAGSATRTAGWIAAAMMCVLLLVTQRMDPEVQRAIEEKWEWEGKVIGEYLREAFGKADPLIACDPAGCIPYFSRLRCIDMMGLNDYHIARQRPKEFGKGGLGHELGDGKYVLERRPDLVLWNRPTGSVHPMFPSAVQMAAEPVFRSTYRFVFLQTSGPSPLLCGIWLRTDSEKLGVQTFSDHLVVPGLIAATDAKTPAQLDSEGRMGVVVTSEHAAVLPGLGIPPGKWRVSAESDMSVRISLKRTDGAMAPVGGIGQVIFDSGAAEAAVDIELSTVNTSVAHVRQIILFPAR